MNLRHDKPLGHVDASRVFTLGDQHFSVDALIMDDELAIWVSGETNVVGYIGFPEADDDRGPRTPEPTAPTPAPVFA